VGLMTYMVGVSFYMMMIIYAIWKRKLVNVDQMNDEEKKYCDTLVVGWIRFEIRLFIAWMVSCAVFLLMLNIYKFKSKFKTIQEEL
jgi:hypothetical protein